VRRTIAILLCLAFGATCTTVVAALSLLYAPTTAQGLPNGFSSQDAVGRQPGTVFFKKGEAYLGIGLRQEMNYWVWIPRMESGTGIYGIGVEYAYAGWPVPAFRHPPLRFAGATGLSEFEAAAEHVSDLATTSDLPAVFQAKPYRVLTTSLLPLGFAANTLLSAAAAGVLVVAPGALRRARRRRSGRCVACGYPLPGSSRCPECGVPAPATLTARAAAILELTS
jgi:hypothetical protein